LPGESQTVQYTAPVPADSQGQTITNTVEIVYCDQFDVCFGTEEEPAFPLMDDDDAECNVPNPPCVEVDKTVTPETSKGTGLEEDAVEFTIEVCNCGEIAIQPVSVTDDLYMGGGEGNLNSAITQILDPAECEEFSYPYIISVAEGEADNLTNTVTVVYEDIVVGAQANDEDNATVALLHPDYTFEISCMEDGPVAPGTQIMFSATLINTGDADLIVDTTLPAPPAASAPVTDIALAKGATVTIDITVTAGSGSEEILGATATATIAPPYDYLPNQIVETAEGACEIGCSDNCATRTLGFWKTHCDYTEHVFEVHMGGEMRIGCEDDVLTTIEQVLGVLYANNAKNTDGKFRTPDCQAFAIASKQVVVALLNNSLSNGAPLPYTVEQIQTIMCTGTKEEILALSYALDEYNNSGDDYAIEEPGDHNINPTNPATPQQCRDDAALGAADCAGLSNKQAKKLGLL
jgi:hypothetical protein